MKEPLDTCMFIWYLVGVVFRMTCGDHFVVGIAMVSNVALKGESLVGSFEVVGKHDPFRIGNDGIPFGFAIVKGFQRFERTPTVTSALEPFEGSNV